MAFVVSGQVIDVRIAGGQFVALFESDARHQRVRLRGLVDGLAP
jgi:hypothetical protein